MTRADAKSLFVVIVMRSCTLLWWTLAQIAMINPSREGGIIISGRRPLLDSVRYFWYMYPTRMGGGGVRLERPSTGEALPAFRCRVLVGLGNGVYPLGRTSGWRKLDLGRTGNSPGERRNNQLPDKASVPYRTAGDGSRPPFRLRLPVRRLSFSRLKRASARA